MEEAAEERDYREINEDDLREMIDPAGQELDQFLQFGNGNYAVYRERLIAICLCQVAARHYLDKKTGVKDIDIRFFFEEHERVKIPHFRNMRKSVNVILPRLGTKRVDFMKKTIAPRLLRPGNTLQTIRNYLREARTRPSFLLSKKPVIGLLPNEVFGQVFWEGNLGF